MGGLPGLRGEYMRANHTPLPWHYDNEPGTEPYEFYVRESVSGWEHPVAHLRFNISVEEAEANAEFIVRAVNCHEELTSALGSLLDEIGMSDTPYTERYARYRALSRRAEGA